MTNFKRTTGIISMLLLIAAMITGCSDSYNPVESTIRTPETESASSRNLKVITRDLKIEIHPLSEVTLKADDLGIAYFTAVNLTSGAGYDNNDNANLCSKLVIKSGNVREAEIYGCSASGLNANTVTIKNVSKTRVQLKAGITGTLRNTLISDPFYVTPDPDASPISGSGSMSEELLTGKDYQKKVLNVEAYLEAGQKWDISTADFDQYGLDAFVAVTVDADSPRLPIFNEPGMCGMIGISIDGKDASSKNSCSADSFEAQGITLANNSETGLSVKAVLIGLSKQSTKYTK